ncbi:MAG: hypothetical protein L3J43_07900 [Sulfurovum sp.]|nr:hypothetical protein [Sulfurovum sp.]
MNEIQRKFLLSADIKRWLDKQTFTLEKTEKFYVKSKNDTVCYYIKTFPDTYVEVMIDKEGEEAVLNVTEKDYLLQRQKHLGRKVVKKAYTVTIDEEVFVFYEYLKKLKGLYLLESYFSAEKEMRESKTIETLQSFVLKEIDKDEKYMDQSLALSAKPMEYDLNKFFEKIDAYEAANLFFWQVPRRMYVRDGVTLILYKNLRLIHHYQVQYQRKHFSATLHRLRVLLRRTATLLETFPSLFNPNVHRFCVSLLMRYHEETKILRYLYFLEELCGTKEDATLSLHSELKSITSEEEKAVVQMLFDKPFKQLIQIMTRELYEEGYHQGKTLEKEVKKVVRTHLKEFELLLVKTKIAWDEDLLAKLYNSIDSLQTLVEDFYHILGEKEIKILVEELNILLKPLREYRNCKERESVLFSMKEQSENKSLNIKPLICDYTNELKAKIENALKLLRTSNFHI